MTNPFIEGSSTEPENPLAPYVRLARDADFRLLAKRTKGHYVRHQDGTEVVLWSQGRLTRETNPGDGKTVNLLKINRGGGQDVSNTGLTIGSYFAAFIDPVKDIISGIEVINGKLETIMGNEANFYPSYLKARQIAINALTTS